MQFILYCILSTFVSHVFTNSESGAGDILPEHVLKSGSGSNNKDVS